MAFSDYRLCDVCGCKCFYDVSLNYEFGTEAAPIPLDQQVRESGFKLERLGDWAVICMDCAKTHECKIVPRTSNAQADRPAKAGERGES